MLFAMIAIVLLAVAGRLFSRAMIGARPVGGGMWEARGLPWPLCKWWTRTRRVLASGERARLIDVRPDRSVARAVTTTGRQVTLDPGEIVFVDVDDFDLVEMYVPWWAWPLELAHRLVFGHRRLTRLPDAE